MCEFSALIFIFLMYFQGFKIVCRVRVFQIPHKYFLRACVNLSLSLVLKSHFLCIFLSYFLYLKTIPLFGACRSFSAVGVDPAVMGIGPAVAIPAAVNAAGLQIEDIDLFELNEVNCKHH